MNQYIFDVAQKFEEIHTELSHEMSVLQVFNEREDLTETYETYYRDSRKELLEILKKFFLEENRNDFVTLFGVYCNFYLKRGFHCSLPEKDFGISELWNVITNENFQKYLLLIQQGIFEQEEKFFEDALNIFDEYSLPHLYLFVFAAQKYDLVAYDNSSEEQKQFLESAQDHYNKMNSSLRKYSLGIGNFIFKSANPSDDRNLLPFVKAVDVYRELVLYATEKGAMSPLFGIDLFSDKLVDYLKFLTGKQLTEKERSDFENAREKLKGCVCSPLQRLDALLKEIFQGEDIKLSRIAPVEWRDTLPPFNIAYLKIPLKISNAGRFLLDQMEKLKLQDEKLKLQEKQEKLVAGFTHKYKNLRATQLGNIAQSLLRMEDEREKNWGRALLLEQARKETMNKEVTLLTLHYEGNAAKLVNILIESLADEEGVDISEVLQVATLNCFVEFFYAKKGDPPKMRARVEELWNDLDAKKISFEREVIFNRKNSIGWMRENGFRLQIEIDERWEKISFLEDDYAEVFFRDIFLEMLKNFLKYGKVTKPMTLKLHSNKSTLKISMKNFIAPKFADDLKESTQKGLITMDDTMKSLYEGKGLRIPESCISRIQNDETFCIELKLPAEVFLKGENLK